MDPRTITGPNWPVVLATLEQLSPDFGTESLRIGLATLLYRTAFAMSQPGASVELVGLAQRLLDALRHMPWEATTPVSPSR